nr:gliding motility-associated C-terminal domain-containing protein [Bacteroidota bacterium]
GEYVATQNGAIVWSNVGGAAGQPFTTPGVPPGAPTISLTATPAIIGCGDESTLNAVASGICSGVNITWGNGLPSGSSHVVKPNNTTTYTVSGTDLCTNQTVTATATVTVKPTDTTIYITKCPQEFAALHTTAPSTITQYTPVSFTNTIRYPIKDNQTINSPVNVSGLNVTSLSSGSNIKVCVNILHQRNSDMSIRLVSPANTVYNLSTYNGGNGANYNNVCFIYPNPVGQFPIINNITAAPNGTITGNWVPQQLTAFAALNGENPNGTWNLQVFDNVTGMVGSIENWTLTINDEAVIPNPNYSWNTTNFLIDPYSPTPQTNTPVTQTYVLTADLAGCTYRDTFEVNVHPDLLSVTPLVGICLSSPVAAQLNAFGPMDSISWHDPTNTLNNTNITNPLASPTVTTQYPVYMRDNSNFCVKMDTVTVVITPDPVVIITGPDTVCKGSSAQLIASGGPYTYFWTDGEMPPNQQNLANPLGYPTFTQSYNVTATDTVGCIGFGSHPIWVKPAPEFTTTPDKNATICKGDTLQITSSLAPNYSWSPSYNIENLTSANTKVWPDKDTTYTVTAFDGICPYRNEIKVTVNTPIPITATGPTDLCMGSTGTLNTNASNPIWSPEANLSSSTVPNPILTGGQTQVYTVSGMDINGCKSSAQIKITVNPVPSINVGDTIFVCPNSDLQLEAKIAPTAPVKWTSNTSGVTYTPSDTDLSPVVTVPNNQNTTFTATVTNSFGCAAQDIVEVIFTDRPIDVVIQGLNATCAGKPNGVASVTNILNTAGQSTPFTGYTFAWSPTGATGSTANDLHAGFYTVTVMDIASKCLHRETIEIKQPFDMEVHFSTSPEWCQSFNGSAIVDSVRFAKQPLTYLWEYTSSTDAVNANVSGGYQAVTVTSADGCEKRDSVYVNSTGDAVTASFVPSVVEGFPPLTVDFTNHSINGMTYEWNFDDGTTSNVKDPLAVFTEPGKTYRVQLKAIGTHCEDTTSMLIFVKHNLAFTVPNVFTPNGDEHNAMFTIQGEGMEIFRGEIYTRWGRKIFEWNDPMSGWDGSGYEDGVYFYVITYSPYSGDPAKLSGHVTLIR